MLLFKNQYAGIQYLGESDLTEACKQAVIKLIHFGHEIKEVKILTTAQGDHCNSHAFLLTVDDGVKIAIKNGFTSGYPGEGSKGYAFVLKLLSNYTDNISEYITPTNIFKHLTNSCLTVQDIEVINHLKKVSPTRWYDEATNLKADKPNVFHDFPLTIPMALIDHRLIEIALKFNSNPDNSITHAYRKIESIVRERANLKHESGTKLFSKSFQGDKSLLYWENLDSGENNGRASLFTSAFMAYRNNRAHQEPKHDLANDIREFLLFNQLFILESEAIVRKQKI